ncbi:hypothetical protein NDA16_001962 [Ustilago loliicola]|nr:hypothetical protein NDA16_001962 [Ustilago loliicola]
MPPKPSTPSRQATSRAAGAPSAPIANLAVLMACKVELETLKEQWVQMDGIRVYRLGLQVIDFALEAVNADRPAAVPGTSGSGWYLQFCAPYEENMLTTLFRAPPLTQHVLGELMGSLETVTFHDCNLLRRDDSITYLMLWAAWDPVFNKHFKPIMGVQSRCFVHPQGLLECVPVPLQHDVFPDCGISPKAVFANDKVVTIGSRGIFVPPHIEHGSLGTLHTVIDGWKFFMSWAASDRNRKTMQTWHLRQLTWDDSLDLMRELEHPLFNYHSPGHTVYIAAGRVSLMMSADTGGIYTIKMANPSVKEWNDILLAHKSAVEGFVKCLFKESPDLIGLAVDALQFELDLWRKVIPGLPERRTADTVSKREVEEFVAQQGEDLALLRDVYVTRQRSRASVVASVGFAGSSSFGPPSFASTPPRRPQEGMAPAVAMGETVAEGSGSSRAREKRRISLVYDSEEEQEEAERREPTQ